MVTCVLREEVMCVYMREVRGRREREEGGGEGEGREMKKGGRNVYVEGEGNVYEGRRRGRRGRRGKEKERREEGRRRGRGRRRGEGREEGEERDSGKKSVCTICAQWRQIHQLSA